MSTVTNTCAVALYAIGWLAIMLGVTGMELWTFFPSWHWTALAWLIGLASIGAALGLARRR